MKPKIKALLMHVDLEAKVIQGPIPASSYTFEPTWLIPANRASYQRIYEQMKMAVLNSNHTEWALGEMVTAQLTSIGIKAS